MRRSSSSFLVVLSVTLLMATPLVGTAASTARRATHHLDELAGAVAARNGTTPTEKASLRAASALLRRRADTESADAAVAWRIATLLDTAFPGDETFSPLLGAARDAFHADAQERRDALETAVGALGETAKGARAARWLGTTDAALASYSPTANHSDALDAVVAAFRASDAGLNAAGTRSGFVVAMVDGQPWTGDHRAAFLGYLQRTPSHRGDPIAVDFGAATGDAQGIRTGLNFSAWITGPGTYALDGTQGSGDFGDSGGSLWSTVRGSQGSGTITFSRADARWFEGTFSFTAVPAYLDMPATTRTITNGVFRIRARR